MSMFIILCLNHSFAQPDSEYGSLDYALFDSLSRIIWAIALCYIIFACAHNYGGPVTWLLAHPLWQPISRLSYSMYLTHFFIIRMTIASVMVSNYFSDWIAVSFATTFLIKTNIYPKEFLFNFQLQSFIVNFTFTVLISTVLTLAIESRISKIKELIFTPKTKTKLNSENIYRIKKL